MKLKPHGLGAEPKKVAALVALLAAIPVVYYYNSQPDAPRTPARAVASTGQVAIPLKRTLAARPPTRVNDDFRPSLKLSDDFDVSAIDPTLRLDLLARVRAVGDVGGRRSLFEFYTPPPPPTVQPIKVAPPAPPVEAKPAPPPAIVKQPPPPIPLKFYGYSGAPRDGRLKALFVDGEETFIVAQGDLIRNRYRITRIGVTSVELEDNVTSDRQTLRILDKCDDKDDRCKQ